MLSTPPFFKEIFKHLPNALLDLISWREMFVEITILSNRLLTEKGAMEAKLAIGNLRIPNVEITEKLSLGKLTTAHGEIILKIYFLQILKGSKIFLDLRPKHFSGLEQTLQWSPGGLWAELDASFVQGIRKIYIGYYCNNDLLFAEGMEESGLVKSEWNETQKNEVIDVFKKYFSNGRNQPIAFDIEVFKLSFAQIFKTLVKNKIELDKNFLYLGIMLVTLYITLNEIGGRYDVALIFHDASIS